MRRRFAVLSALFALGLMLTGCGTAAGASASADGRIAVVASTNVYGSIAELVGGDRVSVTSLIGRPGQDPHSYEANAQDKLSVSKARLAVENGGGYDDFFDVLAHGVLDPNKIINVVGLSGLETNANRNDFNEHVWYSLDVVSTLADTIAARLAAIEPANAPAFTANAAAFKASLAPLKSQLATLRGAHGGQPVAITEPIPLYLLQAAGLENRTPAAYSHAIEAGTDVPAGVLKETEDLISSRSVKFLAYNSQTEGPQTEVLAKAARDHGVPVVDFTETLPEGQDYVHWMSSNVAAVAAALS
jgi:zinc/manganese transport system substrate-binding protein